jgi:hypothetical protein
MEMLRGLRVPMRDVDARRHTRDPEAYGVMRGFLTPESSEGPVDVAVRFLRANDVGLGEVFTKGPALAAETPGRLAVESRVRTPGGYHVRFQQLQSGVPVTGAGASVHMAARRQVHMATNDLARGVPSFDVEEEKAAGVTDSEAIRRAVRAVDGRGRLRGTPGAELVIHQFEGRWYLAWKVSVGLAAGESIETNSDRSAAWAVFVDVRSGDILNMMDILTRATGRGKVFHPNPVVTLRDTRLDPDTRFPEYAYRHVTLHRLSGTGYLTGKYVSTRLTPQPRAYSSNHEFFLDSHQPGFEEVMAYYWIDRVCSDLQRLGFKGSVHRPFPVNVCGTEEDQSWYDPQTRELSFGRGGVNDAEDADIILHELGHAFLDCLVPGWGDAWYGAPVRALGEGMGDMLACCYLADVDGGFHPEVVGDWDALPLSLADPPALRRVDGGKTLHSVPGRGTSTSVTEDTLSDSNAQWVPGALVGSRITPKVRVLGHPAYFEIVDNTSTSIKVDVSAGDVLTAHGDVGDHYAGEEHQDGEFWSAVLWDIYLGMGGGSEPSPDSAEACQKVLTLALTAHKYLDDRNRDTIEFLDAADALLEADRLVWGPPTDPGPHESLLKEVFRKRKLVRVEA